MKSCPFCMPQIYSDNHAEVALENELCLFISGPQPVLNGSGMIIPRAHRETLFDLTQDEWEATYSLLHAAKELIDDVMKPDGYNVGWNCGSVGGQSVFHAHLHVIPRFADEPLARRGIRWRLKQEDNRRPAKVVGEPKVEIRPLESEDIQRCVVILRSLPAWFGIEEALLAYGEDLKTLDGFAAFMGNKLVGFVGLKRYPPQAAEVNVIAVSPEERRQGIGARLLHAVESDCAASRIKLLHAKTLSSSDPDPNYAETRAFWQAKGFIPMDEHLLWGADNPCLVLVKPLL